MEKIIDINGFYSHILKIKIEFLDTFKQDDIRKSLLTLVNNALKEMIENNWHLESKGKKTLQNIYYEEEWTLNNSQEKLILFILLKEFKWKIKENFFSWFIEALIFSQTNPYNYKNYIEIFLKPEVYSLILEIETTEMSFILARLIETIPITDNFQNTISAFIYHLSKVTKNHYSPLFKGNYNLNNIYLTLKSQMNEANQKYIYFLEKDFQTLQCLLDLQNNLSNLEKEELMKRIEEIESNNDKSFLIIIREILKEVQSWSIKDYRLIRQQK